MLKSLSDKRHILMAVYSVDQYESYNVYVRDDRSMKC